MPGVKTLMHHFQHNVTDGTTRMVEVPASPDSLDSNSCFLVTQITTKVIEDPEDAADEEPRIEDLKLTYAWYGRAAPEDVREFVQQYADIMKDEDSDQETVFTMKE